VAPSNTYRCADGKYIVVSGNGDAIFRRLMHAVGRADLAADPRFTDNAGRVAHAGLLDDAIGAWAATLTQEAAEAVLRTASVPCGPILTAADIAKDPHFTARGMHERHRVPGLDGEVTFPGIVPALAERPGRTRTLGPELGEHTEAVLAELGITGEAVTRLRESGVI
jgi:formyl-CoA transferase